MLRTDRRFYRTLGLVLPVLSESLVQVANGDHLQNPLSRCANSSFLSLSITPTMVLYTKSPDIMGGAIIPYRLLELTQDYPANYISCALSMRISGPGTEISDLQPVKIEPIRVFVKHSGCSYSRARILLDVQNITPCYSALKSYHAERRNPDCAPC